MLSLAAAFVSVALAGAWHWRLGAATRLARRALEREGLGDVSFRLVRLSPGCLAVEDLRVGEHEPVFSADRVEARFTLEELRRGQLARLRVRGVRVPAVVDGGRLVIPLQQWLAEVVAARARRGSGASSVSEDDDVLPSVGELSAYDVQVPVRTAAGEEVATLRGEAGLVAEPLALSPIAAPVRYRAWAEVSDPVGVRGSLSGTVLPQTGELNLSCELRVKDAGAAVERARLAMPDRIGALPVSPTNCSFALRGSLAVSGWTSLGPFDVTAELGRGSAFTLRGGDGFVRFQTCRAEASGTLQDAQCRLSAGVAGFRAGSQIRASQQEGRLLSLRGAASYRETPTNRLVRASLESDLPGKLASQVLSTVLPLLPRLLSDGQTLRAEAELARPAGGAWQGQVSYAAEARRNTLTLPAGRVGAARVAIEGALAVRDGAAGELTSDIRVEDGFFFRSGMSVRGGGVMALRAQPPYRSAAGTFTVRLDGAAALARLGLTLPADGVALSGTASVDGLVSNPVWSVALEVPAFAVASVPGAGKWRAATGASARIQASVSRFSLEGIGRASCRERV